MKRFFGLVSEQELKEAQEQARAETRKANEERIDAEEERKAAAKAKTEAAASTKRAEEAEERARIEKERANEKTESAEKERKAAEKAKTEAAASIKRAEEAEEQARIENERANEKTESAEKERIAAEKAKTKAAASAKRAEEAEERARIENERANEKMQCAEKERIAAVKEKTEATASARRAEEQAKNEIQKALEAKEIAEGQRVIAEQEKQRLQHEKEEKRKRDETLMQFHWGPKSTRRWTTQEVEDLSKKFNGQLKDGEGNVIRAKIVIFGPSGTGKSSFCNGLRSALKDSDTPSTYYAVGITDASLTSSFQPTPYGDHWIIDMPGIFESSEFKTENVEAIASGRVRFDAQITRTLDVKDKMSLGEERRDVSCVVLVLHHGVTLGDELKRQLNAIIRLGGDGALSYHLVLTHLDECDQQFKDPDNIPNLYNSPLVQEAVKNMSEQTGIPPYAISYVKNYVTETETDTNTKLLHLRALDRILTSAADQVEKMNDLKRQKNMYKDASDV